jgi:uncharacterized LabA/DUF88 family protein
MPAQKRVALLIDAENVNSSHIDAVVRRVSTQGRVTVRRAYADWTKNRDHWTPVLRRHGIRASHLTQVNAAGKNAADIALVIDAMDLRHAGAVDVLAIVSSDGDFAPLALRAREDGLTVLGFGRKAASEALRQACEFVTFEELHAAPRATSADPRVAIPSQRDATTRADETLHSELRTAVAGAAGDDGWAHMGQLGTPLKPLRQRAGYGSLSGLFRATGIFHVDGHRVRARA